MSDMFLINSDIEINISNTENKVIRELWNGFCNHLINAKFILGEKNKISIGKATFITPEDGDEYTICIKKDGIGIMSDSECGLYRGFMMLLMCIEQLSADTFGIECRDIHGKFSVKTRMVHLCVFPETSYETLKRRIRLCGVLQYTHIIIEFWGMLKYDCMKELSWPNAFEKEDVQKLISEIRGMGMEPVPMFNHLGHASQCRVINGKHTVLDQNPGLSYLFTPDGWAWNIHLDETYKLLGNIRKELYEIFGDGEYVHLGCDEAYIFSNGYITKEELREYLRKITAETVSEGRKPILWGDMLVCFKEAGCVGGPYYCADIEEDEAEIIRKSLADGTIIADWQYDSNIEREVKTSVALKNKGYDVLVCPWFDTKNIEVCVKTAETAELNGVIQTTWHTLSDKMPTLLICARKCGLPETSWSAFALPHTETATLLRKVSGTERTYENCGFTAHQVEERNSND